jgi:hypothetical protein
MDGIDRGARSGVMRRQVWQDILDWLRPVDHEVSASRHALNPVEASGVDLGAPASAALSGEALAGGGALAGQAWSSERADPSFAEEAAHEIDEAELLEFLSTDHDPVPADPVFREELRDQLWALVQEGAGMRPKDH